MGHHGPACKGGPDSSLLLSVKEPFRLRTPPARMGVRRWLTWRIAAPATDSPPRPLEQVFCKFGVQKSKSLSVKVTTMDEPRTNLTPPLLSGDSTLWFSAYGFGWGYCAFAIPAEMVCEKLAAANETPKQLMLAFELGKRRLLQAVEQKALPGTGERITLSPDDL